MYNINENNIVFHVLKSKIMALALLFVFAGAILGSLTLCNATRITINDDGKSTVIFTVADEPNEVLKKAGITPLSASDLLYVSPTVGMNSNYVIERNYNVTVEADGKQLNLTTHSCNVEELLKNVNVLYDSNDEITPSLETRINSDITVSVNRVEYVTYVAVEKISYSTIEEEDSSIDSGSTKIKTNGVDGSAQNEYINKLVNGQLYQSTLVSQDVITEPVNEVKLVGTGSEKVINYNAKTLNTVSTLSPDIDIKLDESGRPIDYKKVYTGTASAYSAEDGDYTATGTLAQVGYVAVDPNVIPYGSKLFIRTSDDSYIYGYAIAADTGGFVKWGSRLIDLYFSSNDECYQFGLRNVEVYVLE